MAEPSSTHAAERLHRTPVRELPGLHQLVLPTPWDVGAVQVYLIAGRPMTLVDTGVKSTASWAALETALAALGHRPRDIEQIVLTHYHGDHLGQAESIRRSGATVEVLCHASERVKS